MFGSINKVILVGRVGKDPEEKTFDNGGCVVSFSLATTNKKKIKDEWKDETEWHNIKINAQKLCELVMKFVTKGSLVYVEGSVRTRAYDHNGETRYVTEIIVGAYNGQVTILQSNKNDSANLPKEMSKPCENQEILNHFPNASDLTDDEIPF